MSLALQRDGVIERPLPPWLLPLDGSPLSAEPVGGAEPASIYLHARYYDPQLGSFLSPDPIGPEGGLNSYGYAFGDPANLSDPYGLVPGERRGVIVIRLPGGRTVTFGGPGGTGGGSTTFTPGEYDCVVNGNCGGGSNSGGGSSFSDLPGTGGGCFCPGDGGGKPGRGGYRGPGFGGRGGGGPGAGGGSTTPPSAGGDPGAPVDTGPGPGGGTPGPGQPGGGGGAGPSPNAETGSGFGGEFTNSLSSIMQASTWAYAHIYAMRQIEWDHFERSIEVSQGMIAPPFLSVSGARLLPADFLHIMRRHWATSAAHGVGKFGADVNTIVLRDIIRSATTLGTQSANTLGRAGTRWLFDAGRVIGTTGRGASTSWVRVVVRPDGTVVTAFPVAAP